MTKKTMACLFSLLFVLAAGLQAQFIRTYGSQGSYSDPKRILSTPEGGLIVFGNSQSRTSLIKLAADGSFEWERWYYTNYEPIDSACKTPEGGYVLMGGSNSSVWLIKTDSLGGAEWQRTIANSSGTTDLDYAVCPAGDSGYFITGCTMSAGISVVWVIKVDLDGNLVWQKTYGQSYGEDRVSAEAASDGGCVVAARINQEAGSQAKLLVFKIDTLGVLSWQKILTFSDFSDCKIRSIRRTLEGGYLLAGSVYGPGHYFGLVLKMGEDGAFEWARSYAYGELNALWPAQDGGSIVTGNIGDILVMKLLANGDIEWQKDYGGCNGEIGIDVVQTPEGDYAVAGQTASFGAGLQDICVLRFSDGNDFDAYRFCRSASLAAATANVSEAEAVLSIQDTVDALQTANFDTTTAGFETYQLCTTKKLLTVYSPLGGYIISPGVGTHLYNAGTVVTIQAQANITEGDYKYTFTGWSCDATGSANPITITMTDDMTVTALYQEEWGGGGGGGGGGTGKVGGCFIATAAYRSPLHPAVKLLQNFRDKRLLTNPIGRAFVATYYKWSPSAARLIGRSAWLRFIARIFLVPVIFVAAMVLKLGWPAAFLFMAIASALSFRKIRRRLWRRAPAVH